MSKLSIWNSSKLGSERPVYKGSRLSIAAFLLLGLIVSTGCDSEGTVGDGLRTDDNDVVKTTVNLQPEIFEEVDINTFSGRLQQSAAGYVEDPVYGTIRAVTLLKPSISRATVDTIRDGDTVTLKLSLSSVDYGDSTTTSTFDIFEAGELWRGNELRYNEEILIDESTPVASFQITNEDSIEVELSDEWVQNFKTYFNSSSLSRDSTYINEFPGLAIVPAQTNQRIHFIRHLQATEDDPRETELVVYTENTEEENEEEEEEEAEPIAQKLSLRDWGAAVVRTDEPNPSDGIVLHNSERILRIDPEFDSEGLKNRNIVNATLVLTRNTELENLYSEISRPELLSIRAHEFDPVPFDIASEMFINTALFNGIADDDDGNTFRLNITQYVLNEVFGDSDEGSLFLSLQAVNGILYSARFYDHTAGENQRPRIVITSVD